MKRQPTDRVQLKLRMRENLRRKLATAARARDVSLNSEILARLEQSFVLDLTGILQEFNRVYSCTGPQQ